MSKVTKRSLIALARQAVSALLVLALIAPTASLAMSTAKETAVGAKENQQIDEQSVVIHDPFLTSMVDRIGSTLAQRRIRRDITYRFTIIDDQSINAFAIKGGYVHVNMGLLNFVSSDDELAATLGHEMGHVELHHVTKGDNTNTIIGILESIASLISIPTAILGGIGGELAAEKYSRIDELQADHYGLGIMSASGYDPEGAVDLMRKLGSADESPDTRIEKAFLDHPVPSDRVAHLLGYPPLDRPTSAQIMARAAHDAAEGRYSYARATLALLPSSDPIPEAQPLRQQLDYALRESGALAGVDSRAWQRPVLPSDPRWMAALAALRKAQSDQIAALDAAKTQSRLAGLELMDLETKLSDSQSLSAAASPPQPSPQPSRSGGPPSAPPIGNTLDRDLNEFVNLVGDTIGAAPGIVISEAQPIGDMSGPLLEDAPLTPKYAALLPYYPQMTAGIDGGTADLVDAIGKDRAAIARIKDALGVLDDENQRFQAAVASAQGRPDRAAMAPMHLAVSKFLSEVAGAMATARAASNEMYGSQADELSAQLSLLDLYSSRERYDDFAQAVAFRFPGVQLPAYESAQSLHLPAGQMGCAAWLAFESGESLTQAAAEISGASCMAAAESRNLNAESMEIAEGLLYEDYDETPQT